MNYLGVFLSLLVATSVIVVGGSGVVAAQTDVTLTVTVATEDGTTIENATLAATWDDGSTNETTKSNGKAFVDVPDGADVTIAVSHPDYVRNAPVEVDDASERDVTVTVAEKASATITVEDDDGTVDGATVVLRMDGHRVVRADTTDGTVSTGTIEAGTYDLTVRKPGYFEVEDEFAVENATERTVTIERGTVPLGVNVTDDYFDPPRAVSDATVSIEDVGTVDTQSDGTQRVSVPVNTELDVNVSKDGYDAVERVVSVGESETSIAVDLDRSASLSVETLSENVVVGERVLVTVTDEYDDPVEDARVFVDGESVARTDADGTATITIEAAGDQEITASKNETTSPAVAVNGVVTGGTTTESTTTESTTEASTTTGTDQTTESPAPAIPDTYLPLIIVGVALLAVLFGIRRWQR